MSLQSYAELLTKYANQPDVQFDIQLANYHGSRAAVESIMSKIEDVENIVCKKFVDVNLDK